MHSIIRTTKQIICMGTSEIRFLESTLANGGETYDGDGDGIPQYTDVNRLSKDYVEGWGSVYPIAAIEAVTKWLTVGSSETVSLSGKLGEQRVTVRQVSLESGIIYRMEGNYTVSNFIDADLLLFKGEPTLSGDPILLANCSLGLVANDSTLFTVPEDGTYYLAVRWVYGNYQGQCKFSISPIVTIQDYSDGDILQSGLTLSFTIDSANLNKLEYYWDIDAPSVLNTPYQITTPSGEGIHILYIVAEDIFGKQETESFTFIIDNTDPTIVLADYENEDEIEPGTSIVVEVTDLHLEHVYYTSDTQIAQLELEFPYTVSAPSLSKYISRTVKRLCHEDRAVPLLEKQAEALQC